MRMNAWMLGLSLAVGVAIAQSTPPDQTTPQTKQSKTTSDTKAASSSTSTSASTGTPAEMKTTTYKGTLVDLGCGSSSAAGTAGTAGTPQTTTARSTAASTADTANSANRSSTDASCPVTASSTQLGMKLDDGRVVRFDLVGMQRAQDELKNNKRWVKDTGAGKAIHASVSGVLNGDKLIVSSIH